MNTTQAQHKDLDDALVAHEDRLEFGKCNMKLKTDIKPKEATFQVALHFGDIIYLSDVNVDYLHQPWRAFSTIINKCLSGKETGIDNIQYKEAKKTNKMSYPRFTKIIIDYFMSKDQYEDTQVYGTILLKEQTNQAMLESKAYKTYHTFASGEKTPKPKYARKKADSDTSPKQKPVQATKGDGVDTQLKVPDEEDLKTIGADEGTGTKLGVPDLPIYKSESEKESWGDSENEDKDDENDSDGISDEGDDDNDGNNGNDGDDDDANNDDKQEGDDTNDDDEETDSDRTELDRIKIPILDQSTTEYYEEEE
ncbi:hypothetical protein Tco_0953438 [Tanacetum coccineum]|uniref:Uncharacterized protein n=1 Tax=Tanacetum coccineum TaxID=301880 RepID=A0ABQ5E096_9ASTR